MKNFTKKELETIAEALESAADEWFDYMDSEAEENSWEEKEIKYYKNKIATANKLSNYFEKLSKK